MNSCSKRTQAQGRFRLTLLSSSRYFTPSHSDSRDHGSLWRGTGHPHHPTPGRKPARKPANSTKAALSISWEEAKSRCFHPNNLLWLISPPLPQRAPFGPIPGNVACEVLDADSTATAPKRFLPCRHAGWHPFSLCLVIGAAPGHRFHQHLKSRKHLFSRGCTSVQFKTPSNKVEEPI